MGSNLGPCATVAPHKITSSYFCDHPLVHCIKIILIIPFQYLIQLPEIGDGVLVHGLYTDAFRFDEENNIMASERDRVMNERLPLMHMEPKMDFVPAVEDYICPLYKTAARAGVLSTTGI